MVEEEQLIEMENASHKSTCCVLLYALKISLSEISEYGIKIICKVLLTRRKDAHLNFNSSKLSKNRLSFIINS